MADQGGNSGGVRAGAISSATSTSSGTARNLYLSDEEKLEVMVTWVHQWVPIDRDPLEAESDHDALSGSSCSLNEPNPGVTRKKPVDAFLVDSNNEFEADDMASMVHGHRALVPTLPSSLGSSLGLGDRLRVALPRCSNDIGGVVCLVEASRVARPLGVKLQHKLIQ
ncbi:hypothetical protein PanWU01x14_205660 [Parasponia andersonii]|uniref:Uncharacterized protein n=1 Tax=Parasponia andersonii TaxID=3476 RepID=A0A2P5BW56_PARAD|nr:hypothetical protein PanWU01x14_205660 [Parasponia andersonii]